MQAGMQICMTTAPVCPCTPSSSVERRQPSNASFPRLRLEVETLKGRSIHTLSTVSSDEESVLGPEQPEGTYRRARRSAFLMAFGALTAALIGSKLVLALLAHAADTL